MKTSLTIYHSRSCTKTTLFELYETIKVRKKKYFKIIFNNLQMTCSKDGGGDDASTITDVPPVLLGLCLIGDRLEADSNPEDPSSSRRFLEPKVISHVLSSHGSSSSSSSSLDFSSPSKSPGKQVNLEVEKDFKSLRIFNCNFFQKLKTYFNTDQQISHPFYT